MIEVIYKEEKKEEENEGMFSLPRNIRQIGLSGGNYRIYVEDYVYTFLIRLAGAEECGENGRGKLAVLTGDSGWRAGVTYVFVRGALAVEQAEAAAEHISLSEEEWKKIHDEQELYFSGQEIVGWFFARPELPLEMTEVFQKAHLKYFGGGEKVLMLMDPAEREDAFFRYENGFLIRQPGYYLFYEKNPQMQTYMIDKNHDFSGEQAEEVPDEAVKAFRKVISSKGKRRRAERKKKPEEPAERTSAFSYAATACLAVAVLAAGVNFYRTYQESYGSEEQIQTASAVLDETEQEVRPEKSEQAQENGLEETEQKQETSPEEAEETLKKLQDELKLKKTVTEVPEPTAVPSVTPEVKEQTEQEDLTVSSDGMAGTSGENTEAELYPEESDIRKGKRKEELAQQSEENEVSQNDPEQNQTEIQDGAAADLTEQPVSGDAPSAEETASGTMGQSYVIRPGDTLYQISLEHYGDIGVIDEICRMNGLTREEIIYPGQIIVLP